jgi:hypothetical protein
MCVLQYILKMATLFINECMNTFYHVYSYLVEYASIKLILNPDIFLWNNLNGRVYKNRLQILNELKNNIKMDINLINASVLHKVATNMGATRAQILKVLKLLKVKLNGI